MQMLTAQASPISSALIIFLIGVYSLPVDRLYNATIRKALEPWSKNVRGAHPRNFLR
jgi:hypothetical protein